MIGIYFSGSGNSKYCIQRFMNVYGEAEQIYSIEDDECLNHIKHTKELVVCYPVQYSNVPKILYDFIIKHSNLWKGKHIFVIATMAKFSGDGSGVLARLLKRYGAVITGGMHVRLTDSIADEKLLKYTDDKIDDIIKKADTKIINAAKDYKNGKPIQEGLGFSSRMLGLFSQRLYFYHKTKKFSDKKLRIDNETCNHCRKCIHLCPTKNIAMVNGVIQSHAQCTLCYRCVNQCPKKAITLLGKQVYQQNNITFFMNDKIR